jgi:hypothetical protein
VQQEWADAWTNTVMLGDQWSYIDVEYVGMDRKDSRRVWLVSDAIVQQFNHDACGVSHIWLQM